MRDKFPGGLADLLQVVKLTCKVDTWQSKN